jgi:hypothetical protein
VIAVAEPRAVVRAEQDHRVPVEIEAAERAQDLADGPVDLHDHVAEEALLRFALEFVRNVQRDVTHRVRHIEEEGLVLVLLDEADGPLRVPGRQLRLVGVDGDGPVALHQRQIGIVLRGFGVLGPHVVRIGQAEVFVEAVVRRQELRQVAKVPFAITGGRVTERLDHLGDGHFAIADANLGLRAEHIRQADPLRVTARHQGRPRRRTHGGGGVEVGEARPLGRHAVDVGRLIPFGPETADIRVAHIVDEDNDEIRQPLLALAGRGIQSAPARGNGHPGGGQTNCLEERASIQSSHVDLTQLAFSKDQCAVFYGWQPQAQLGDGFPCGEGILPL